MRCCRQNRQQRCKLAAILQRDEAAKSAGCGGTLGLHHNLRQGLTDDTDRLPNAAGPCILQRKKTYLCSSIHMQLLIVSEPGIVRNASHCFVHHLKCSALESNEHQFRMSIRSASISAFCSTVSGSRGWRGYPPKYPLKSHAYFTPAIPSLRDDSLVRLCDTFLLFRRQLRIAIFPGKVNLVASLWCAGPESENGSRGSCLERRQNNRCRSCKHLEPNFLGSRFQRSRWRSDRDCGSSRQVAGRNKCSRLNRNSLHHPCGHCLKHRRHSHSAFGHSTRSFYNSLDSFQGFRSNP